MPGLGGYCDAATVRERNRRQRAWQAHYEAKGCSPEKAYWVARRKGATWPPR